MPSNTEILAVAKRYLYGNYKPAPFVVARGVSACQGGMCVLGSSPSVSGVFYVDDDGALRASYGTRLPDLQRETIAAAKTGPVFLLGFTDPSKTPEPRAVVQLAPPP